jgi:antitoxin (DNA-binding transcriptional repressor) of toxin-antitoxin stability system
MAIKTIDVGKEPGPLAELVSLVQSGTEVILADQDKPLARVVPIRTRIAGLNAGSLSPREDFDAPLPDAFWTGGE